MIEIEIPEHIGVAALERAGATKWKEDNLSKQLEVPFNIRMAAAGFVGEHAFQSWCKTAKYVGHKDYDFLNKGFRLDVKSRTASMIPKPHHDHALPERDREQLCHALVFASIRKDFRVAWLAGWAWKQEFFEKLAVYLPAGTEKIRDDGTILKLKTGNYEVTYSKLRGFN